MSAAVSAAVLWRTRHRAHVSATATLDCISLCLLRCQPFIQTAGTLCLQTFQWPLGMTQKVHTMLHHTHLN